MKSDWKVSCRLWVGKESHKFSAAHMTVFPNGSKERLHGHNYSVSVDVELKNTSDFVGFRAIKNILVPLCEAWDERFLIAEKSSFLELQSRSPEVEFKLCGSRYVLPPDDCVFLPVDNITVESLSREMASRFAQQWKAAGDLPPLSAFELRITETSGQSGVVRFEEMR